MSSILICCIGNNNCSQQLFHAYLSGARGLQSLTTHCHHEDITPEKWSTYVSASCTQTNQQDWIKRLNRTVLWMQCYECFQSPAVLCLQRDQSTLASDWFPPSYIIKHHLKSHGVTWVTWCHLTVTWCHMTVTGCHLTITTVTWQSHAHPVHLSLCEAASKSLRMWS